jgi:hypothetical protein
MGFDDSILYQLIPPSLKALDDAVIVGGQTNVIFAAFACQSAVLKTKFKLISFYTLFFAVFM